MSELKYKVKLTTAAQIWVQKNNFVNMLEAVSQTALGQLQQQDLLEIETAGGKATTFSVVRKTVRVVSNDEVTVALLLDHPAR